MHSLLNRDFNWKYTFLNCVVAVELNSIFLFLKMGFRRIIKFKKILFKQAGVGVTPIHQGHIKWEVRFQNIIDWNCVYLSLIITWGEIIKFAHRNIIFSFLFLKSINIYFYFLHYLLFFWLSLNLNQIIISQKSDQTFYSHNFFFVFFW